MASFLLPLSVGLGGCDHNKLTDEIMNIFIHGHVRFDANRSSKEMKGEKFMLSLMHSIKSSKRTMRAVHRPANKCTPVAPKLRHVPAKLPHLLSSFMFPQAQLCVASSVANEERISISVDVNEQAWKLGH